MSEPNPGPTNPSAPTIDIPGALEQFFATLAQGTAEPNGTPMPATEPAPPPSLPTGAPAAPTPTPAAPVAPSAPAAEEAPSLAGQIDPETLAAIQQQARGASPASSSKMEAILKAITHAARVMADPTGTASSDALEAARDERATKGVTEARKLLADLQQNAYNFHKASLQSKQQGEAQEAQNKRALISQHGQMIRAAREATPGLDLPPSPTDLSDPISVNKWLDDVQPMRAGHLKMQAINSADDTVAQAAQHGTLLPQEAVAQKLLISNVGFRSIEEARAAVATMPAYAQAAETAAKAASLKNQQTEANIKFLNSRTANTNAIAERARKGLQGGGGSLPAIKAGIAGVTALRAVEASEFAMANQADSKVQQYTMAYESGAIPQETADYNIAINTQLRDEARSQMLDARMKRTELEAQLQPYAKKMDFAANVPTLSYNALQQMIESDPALYANPQTVLAAIAMPGTNPVKSAYWMLLMTQIRLEYGDNIGLRDIYDAMEQQVYSMANPAMAGEPGAPAAAAGILNPQQELQLGANATKEANARRPKPAPQGAQGAPEKPKGPPYTQGILEKIGAKAGEVAGNVFMPTTKD